MEHAFERSSDRTAMRAVAINGFGGPEVLTVIEMPRPSPDAGQVQVAVRAAFVAHGRDLRVRSGDHPVFAKLVTFPHVLGGEHAGVVTAVGPGVEPAWIGRRVAVSAVIGCGACEACREGATQDCAAKTAIGIHKPGSYAQYTVVPAANVEVIPDALSFEQAAAWAASGPLALEELDEARAAAGEWVLVPGASGSVGLAVVALAALRGARVIALTRGRKAAAELLRVGAHAVLDSADPALGGELLGLAGNGVDVVIDNVADVELWKRYWPAVARRGRVVFAGNAGNHGDPLPVDIVDFYNRRAVITGLTIGDRRAVAAFWELMRGNDVEMPEDLVTVFPLVHAAAAHEFMERGGKVGHVVLSCA
jgi:NADPH:quinone reductase-like Zn-dependent oxidoreductase